MATLALGYADLMNAVSEFLGYGSDYTALTAAKQATCDSIVQSGLRQFYYPPAPPAPKGGYQWGFFRPDSTLSVATKEVNLPDTVGALIGNLTYVSPENAGLGPVQVVGEGRIRELREKLDMEGYPQYVAMVPVLSGGSVVQRYKLVFYPTPDTTYLLAYRYIVVPGKLTATNPYPLGPMMHHETILESCLAVAETRRDDTAGVHNQLFRERLTASIEYDNRIDRPDYLGYNADRSDELNRHVPMSIHHGYTPVSVVTGSTSTVSTSTTDIEAMLAHVWGGKSGVVRTDDLGYLKVAALAVAGMGVSVPAGYAMVANKVWHLSDAETLAITAPTANPRIDLVQAGWDSDGEEVVSVKAGTEAAVPSAPTADTDYIPLAQIACTVGMTQVTAGEITDAREFL